MIGSGKIIDYCLDLRKKSPNYLKVFEFKLKKNNILYIPKGFAHGYLSLSKNTQIIYFLSNYYSKKSECGISYNDNRIKINLEKKL